MNPRCAADAPRLVSVVSGKLKDLGQIHRLMRNHSVTAWMLLAGLLATAARLPSATVVPQERLAPFFEEHCLRCHGPEKQKGQVRFDKMRWEITTNDTAQRWQDVLDVLNGGEMPPAEEKQPAPEKLSHVLDTLTGTLVTARQRLSESGAETRMRRLNRREYANTIRDLFGFTIPADMIPEDAEASSFDTVGTDQFFTSSHFEKYLELSREVVAAGFLWAGKPREEATSRRTEPELRVTPALRKTLAENDEKMRMKNEGKTWQEMGFKDAGDAAILFSQFDRRAGLPRRYLGYPHVESGIYMAAVNNETRRFGMNRAADPRGAYRFRMRGGVVGAPPEIRKFALFSDEDGPIGVVKVRGTPDQPGIVELDYRPNFRHRNMTFRVEENRADIRTLETYLRKLGAEDDWASIWIDWVEIEGPFYDAERSYFERLIHPGAPLDNKRRVAWEDANARELIERFAFSAFRHRRPDPSYVDGLFEVFTRNRASGQTFEQAMGEAMAVILASPGFLFLQEAGGEDDRKRKLDERELAIRLAYFLWSQPPDATLYACAENGTLSHPAVLNAQIKRLLDDPKAESFFRGFAGQWAQLGRFNAVTIDENEFVRFNVGVRHSAAREVVEYFKTLVLENRPAADLIASDFVVINAHLGEHYGLVGANSNAFQKVALPANSPRGGLLGQAAFLIAGSNGERSSPVIRGALVMEKILHDKPSPPPPNVPELGSSSNQPMSNRELVELHQGRPQCASCHRKMDAIGFGLENFDVLGRWRDTEKVGDKQVPIVTGGVLPGGVAFANLPELKALLATRHDRLAHELVASLLAYGLGRTIEFSDADAIGAILREIEPDKYRLRSMINAVAGSTLFHTK